MLLITVTLGRPPRKTRNFWWTKKLMFLAGIRVKYASVIQVTKPMNYDVESEILLHLDRKKLNVRIIAYLSVTSLFTCWSVVDD